ncbi:MAG TPA: hypothetical protein VL860_05680 [Planctomycetota bacterium]|nr:hypothetical protein [Planctomycetota bacterium]
MSHPSDSSFLRPARRCAGAAIGILCLALLASLSAADATGPAPTRTPATQPRLPHPPRSATSVTVPTADTEDAAPGPGPGPTVELSPAVQALIDHFRQLRPNLGDEDGPTRDHARQSLEADTTALIKALFRVPAEEDTPDERKQLALLAGLLQSRIQYEQNLLKIPATRRTAVDTMLEQVPGFAGFFGAGVEDKLKLLAALAGTKPDRDTQAVFLCLVLQDKNPRLVTAVLEQAAQAPCLEYLATAGTLIKKGYMELYLPKDLDEEGRANVLATEETHAQWMAWQQALVKLVGGIPGEGADKLLTGMLIDLTNPEESAIMQNQSGNCPWLVDLANLHAKRGIQSAFPKLVEAALRHSLTESAFNLDDAENGKPIYYSGADLVIYAAYRLIDKSIPERETSPSAWLAWKSNEERLQFYDHFQVAWQNDLYAKKTNRDGWADYREWYENNRGELEMATDENGMLQPEPEPPDLVNPDNPPPDPVIENLPAIQPDAPVILPEGVVPAQDAAGANE